MIINYDSVFGVICWDRCPFTPMNNRWNILRLEIVELYKQLLLSMFSKTWVKTSLWSIIKFYRAKKFGRIKLKKKKERENNEKADLIIFLVIFLAVAGLRHVILGEMKTLREHHGYRVFFVDYRRLTRFRWAARRADRLSFDLAALHVFRY